MNTIDSNFVDWPEQDKQDYFEKGYWSGQLLQQCLQAQAFVRPYHVAVIEGDVSLTYQAMHTRSDRLAQKLRVQGVRSGEHAVIQMPNSIEFYIVFYALLKLGVKPVLALATHRKNEIQQFCAIANAKHYFTININTKFDYVSLGVALNTHLDNGINTYYFGSKHPHPQAIALDTLPDVVETLWDCQLSAQSVAFFQLSGGTTGTPKLIPRTHNDYLYSVKRSAQICDFSDRTRYLVVLPQAHNFPLSSPGALGVFYVGGTVVISHHGEPEQAFACLEKQRITCVALVPPLAITWLTYQHLHHVPLPDLSLIQVGGARLSHEIAVQIEPAFDCVLQQVFGMAEGLVNYTLLTDSVLIKTTTQGQPMSEADQIRVVDDQDMPVAQGEAGHLLTKGPYTIQGYYNAFAHNRKCFTSDGFYRTGDIVSLNSEGYLTVEGRSKDQINRGGEKIAAQEIENTLLKHPAILDVAVVAMPDPVLGEKSCAFFTLKESALQPSMVALNTFIYRQGLADYKLPDRYEHIDVFPQTKFGKVSKQALRDIIKHKLKLLSTHPVYA